MLGKEGKTFEVVVFDELESGGTSVAFAVDVLVGGGVAREFGSVVLGHVESWKGHIGNEAEIPGDENGKGSCSDDGCKVMVLCFSQRMSVHVSIFTEMVYMKYVDLEKCNCLQAKPLVS